MGVLYVCNSFEAEFQCRGHGRPDKLIHGTGSESSERVSEFESDAFPLTVLFSVFYSSLSSKCSSFILSASNIKLPISRGASRRRRRSQEPRNALNPVSSLASGWPLLRCGFPIPELGMARPFPHRGGLMTSLAYWGSCHELEGRAPRVLYLCFL